MEKLIQNPYKHSRSLPQELRVTINAELSGLDARPRLRLILADNAVCIPDPEKEQTFGKRASYLAVPRNSALG
jgi:hypothetical protein